MRIEENNFLRFYMVKKKLKKSEENKFLRIYLMYYGNKWKKIFYYNEKIFCAEKLNFGLLPKYIARLGSWAGSWARLLGRRWARAERAGGRAWARGRGRRWALGLAGHAWQAGGRRTLGRRAGRARQGAAAGPGARGARGAGQRAAWARGLALGCALGALGLFLARFDSVFS